MTSATTSGTASRLVARAAELATLAATLTSALDGAPITVLVGGEGGVGKSRLIREFARAAHESGAQVLTGGCIGLAVGELPYAPLAGMLRGLLRELGAPTVREVAGHSWPVLAQLLPFLADADADEDRTADGYPTAAASEAAGKDRVTSRHNANAGSKAAAPGADGAHATDQVGAIGGPEADSEGEPGGGARLDSAAARARLLEAVLRLLYQLARQAPLVVVMEDLQWADRSTLDLLSFLGAALSRERLVLVASYRTTDLGPGHPLRAVLAELGRHGHVRRLELARFTEAELAEFLTVLTGTAPSAARVRRIHALSDGNAYFVEELVAAGALDVPLTVVGDPIGGGPRPPGAPGPPGTTVLPGSIRDVVLARVEALSSDARDVLRLVATAGRSIRHGLLEAVGDLPHDRLTEALRACVAYHVLVTDPAEGAYVFRHAVGREVVYADLLPGERARLHRALAEALRTRPELGAGAAGGPARAAELAYHWHAAGVLPEALAASVTAAAAATAAYAFAESHRQYERALTLWGQVTDPAGAAGLSRHDLLDRGADAARWAGRTSTAIVWLVELIDGVTPIASPTRLAALWERLGRYRWEDGDGEGSLAAYNRAAALLTDEPPSGRLASVLGRRATAHVLAGDYSAGLRLAEDAAAMAQAVGAPAARSRGLNMAGVALTMLGRPDEGVNSLRAALELARTLGDPEELLRAYSNLGFALEKAGRLIESLAVARTGLAHGRALGIELTGGGVTLTNEVAVLSLLGRWDEAVEVLGDAFRRDVPAGNALFLHLLAAEIDIGRGRFTEADRRLATARALAERVRESQFSGQLHGHVAELAIWRGEHDAARDAVLTGLASVSEDEPLTLQLCALGLRAEADRARRPLRLARRRGDPPRTGPEAGASRTGAAAEDGAGPDVMFAARARDAVRRPAGRPLPDVATLYLLCRVERARFRGRDTPRQWARVAERWERLGRPYPTAYARWREAAAALAARDSRAVPALRQGLELAAQLDATPLRREIELLAQRARVDVGRPDAGPGPSMREPAASSGAARAGAHGPALTPREREVLAYLVEGSSNRVIARRLFIAEKTASVHVSNILAKLAVTNRGEAAAAALRLGLVGPISPGRARAGRADSDEAAPGRASSGRAPGDGRASGGGASP